MKKSACITLLVLTFLVQAIAQNSNPYTIHAYYPETQIDSVSLSPEFPFLNIHNIYGTYPYDLSTIGSKKTLDSSGYIQFYTDSLDVTVYTEYKDGFLLGTDRGLYFYQNGNIKDFLLPDYNSESLVIGISTCNDDILLVDITGTYFWDNDSYETYPIDIEKRISNLVSTCDDWNAFWAYNQEGLYSIGMKKYKSIPPYIKIRLENLQGQELSYGGSIVLPPSTSVRLNYDLYHPDLRGCKIEWRSTPSEAWIPVDKQEPIIHTFSDKPLEYTMRVNLDNSGYTYSAPISVNVKSDSGPSGFWYLLTIPFLVLLLAWIFTRRELSYQRKLNVLKKQNELEVQSLKWRDQTRQLQMNPHFIFNAMNSIQSMIITNKNDDARAYLQKFSKIMRTFLNQSLTDKIPLEEECAFLLNYLELEKISQVHDMTFHIENNAESDILLPPMLIQPLVENAIIHGIKSIDKGHIDIIAHNDSKFLYVEVKDNGIGMEKSKLNKKNNHTSVATSLLVNRLEKMHRFKKGKLVYTDRMSTENKPGTVASLTIPI